MSRFDAERKKLTISEARRHLSEVGITLRRNTVTGGPTGSGEFRVAYSISAHPGMTIEYAEASAYYTDDLDDALATGLRMAKERP